MLTYVLYWQTDHDKSHSRQEETICNFRNINADLLFLALITAVTILLIFLSRWFFELINELRL